MRSLWSGVTGLQAHQIAMDVEGHNIANVNTYGFKYSRANFADLMSQTSKVATAPQGEQGGRNPMQVGLGTQINSITKIFTQGSIQTTGKPTDLAIDGDGFFVISPDGGRTYKYTRSGDFVRDAVGNFVDNNGYIVQGWLNEGMLSGSGSTGIDTTSPIQNIVIKPGLTTPAKATSIVNLKANLNSGNFVADKKSPIYSLDQYNGWYDINKDGAKSLDEEHSENDLGSDVFYTKKSGELGFKERGVDMGVLFNESGEAYNLRKGQGVWVSYADAKTSFAVEKIDINQTGNLLHITLNGEEIVKQNIHNAEEAAKAINEYSSKTGVEASVSNGNEVVLINRNKTGTTEKTKNIKLQVENGNQITSLNQFDQKEVGIVSQGIQVNVPGGGLQQLNITINGVVIDKQVRDIDEVIKAINEKSKDTFITASKTAADTIVFTNNKNATMNILSAQGNQVTFAGQGGNPGDDLIGNRINPPITIRQKQVLTAYQYTYDSSQSSAVNVYDDSVARNFHTTEDLRAAMQTDARLYTNYTGDGDQNSMYKPDTTDGSNPVWVYKNKNDGVQVIVNEKGQFEIQNPKNDAFNKDDDSYIYIAADGSEQTIDLTNAAAKAHFEFNRTVIDKLTTVNGRANEITFTNPQTGAQTQEIVTARSMIIAGTIPAGAFTNYTGKDITIPGYLLASGVDTVIANGDSNLELVFKNDPTTQTYTQFVLPQSVGLNDVVLLGPPAVSFDIRGSGDHKQANVDPYADDKTLALNITGLTNEINGINQNESFTKALAALQGVLSNGSGIRQSQGMFMSTHASSLEVFDSLGSKHSIKFEFAKQSYTSDGGTEWSLIIQVAEPGEINLSGQGPKNVTTGTVRFNSDGSLQGFTPTSLSFSANNGSTPNQNIELSFGNINDFNGLTSYDSASSTSGISQNGYTGGDLNGISVDESGTIIGTFTNGRSFGLAQVAMATFTNNEGLEADGGNVFTQTSNSGEPIIGAAGTGGRGAIKAGSIEMSNVDLSRSLTELIIIQRGYQANSKTITTSDQMLNTLLQLKQ